MALYVSWSNLPSVVLLEIFQRLPRKDRISASSTCKEWRKALFFPKFWREIKIDLYAKREKNAVIERCQFFARTFMSSLRSVTIIFSYQKIYLLEVINVLTKLSSNRKIRKLILYSVGKPIWNEHLRLCITNSLISFLDNAKNLETVYVIQFWSSLLDSNHFSLALDKHKSSLTCLGIGAPYDDFLRSPVDFTVFKQLSILNLDHALLTDDVLTHICVHKQLKRLIVQVKEVYKTINVKSDTWIHFRKSLPQCDLRINIIQGFGENIMGLFLRAMPITHIKLLYCARVSLQSMSMFSSYRDLKSVHCIMEGESTSVTPAENPFVFCAWACNQFEELIISGYKLDYEDLIGIAKLKGPKLKTLLVPGSDVIKLFDIDHTNEWESRNLYPAELDRFTLMMSESLNREWTPADSNIFKNPHASPQENMTNTILDVLLKDLHL